MSEQTAKHTPGPWDVRPATNDDRGIPLYFDVVCAAGHSIGTMHDNECPFDGRPVTIAEAEVNARLAAAAPDLLEACRRALDLHDTTIADNRGKWGQNAIEDCVSKLRAAIAAATE